MNEEKVPRFRTPVDWGKVRARIEKARYAIERGWTPGPEEEKNILRQRARVLAGEPEETGAGEELEIVEFLLAGERYGIAASYVREVCALNDLTPVPCTPPFVLGIINVRGQVVSVIDLKKFFDLPEKGLGDLNKVIILKADAMEFGILADVVHDVGRIALDELQPSLPTLTGIREEYLKGIARDRMVILDAQRLLADGKIVVNEEI